MYILYIIILIIFLSKFAKTFSFVYIFKMSYSRANHLRNIPYIVLLNYNNVALGVQNLLFCTSILITKPFVNPEKSAELYGEGNERQLCVGDC